MRKWLTILMFLVTIGLAALVVKFRMDADREGPVIAFSKDKERIYTEGEDAHMLLKGVRAKDKVDGNVSDTLTVESIYPKKDGGEVVIVYAAKDKSNNVTKAEFTMKVKSAGDRDTETDAVADENADSNEEDETALVDGNTEVGTDGSADVNTVEDAAADSSVGADANAGAEAGTDVGAGAADANVGVNTDVNTGVGTDVNTGTEPVTGLLTPTPTPVVPIV